MIVLLKAIAISAFLFTYFTATVLGFLQSSNPITAGR
jgi:hypothetical protein